VLPILSPPPVPNEEAAAPVRSRARTARQIPRSEHARIRTWVNYGMTNTPGRRGLRGRSRRGQGHSPAGVTRVLGQGRPECCPTHGCSCCVPHERIGDVVSTEQMPASWVGDPEPRADPPAPRADRPASRPARQSVTSSSLRRSGMRRCQSPGARRCIIALGKVSESRRFYTVERRQPLVPRSLRPHAFGCQMIPSFSALLRS
jgi:hypothetical protein